MFHRLANRVRKFFSSVCRAHDSGARAGVLTVAKHLAIAAVFCVNHPIGGVHDELTTICLTLVILLAMVDMAISLEHLRAALRTRLSDPHGLLPSSSTCLQ